MKEIKEMSKLEKINYWRETESVLRDIYGKFKSDANVIPPEYETEFFDYLEHNELGLAFEILS